MRINFLGGIMISASFRLENRFDAPGQLQAEIPPLNFVRAVSTLRFSHDMYGSF